MGFKRSQVQILSPRYINRACRVIGKPGFFIYVLQTCNKPIALLVHFMLDLACFRLKHMSLGELSMVRKNTKALGYLLEILSIKPSELAKTIHIDRTNVSKWISGARSFNSSSNHYKAVIDFIIDTNERKNLNTLENFFSSIYGCSPEKNCVRKCVDRFLNMIDIPKSVYSTVCEAQGSMYHCNIPIYNNVDGRYHTLMDMLTLACNSDGHEHVYLFDNEQFSWLVRQPELISSVIDTIKKILENGHEVTLISNAYYAIEYKAFSMFSYILCSFGNFNEYFLTENMNPRIISSYYLLKDKVVVMGYGLKKGTDEIYTRVMRDPLSVSYSEYMVKEIMHDCRKTEIVTTTPARISVYERLIKLDFIDEVSYLYTPGLTFLTMSRELLIEVLKKNHVYGDLQNALLNLHASLYKTHYKNTPIPLERHVCYYEFLRDMGKLDNIYLDELSVMCGKEVYISKSQYIQHLLDTAERVLSAPNYCMGFLKIVNGLYDQNYSCKTKRNLYHVLCHKVMKYTDEPTVVNTAISILETNWQKDIPYEYKNKFEVAERLTQLAQEISM